MRMLEALRTCTGVGAVVLGNLGNERPQDESGEPLEVVVGALIRYSPWSPRRREQLPCKRSWSGSYEWKDG